MNKEKESITTLNNSSVLEYVFDGSKELTNKLEKELKENEFASILLVNLKEGFSCHFEMKEGSTLNLSILLKSDANSIKMTANLAKNAFINAYCADFSSEKNDSEIIINLNDANARCDWHLASLSSNKDNKVIAVSVNHNFPNTNALVENYGVCKGESRLVFSGTSYILKGSHGSKTRQNSRIMVFDPTSIACAKPILKIDEHDVEASHGAVVGKINDEHMFYLTSRGISVNDARSLITMGYLKPILKGFNDEKYQQEIISLIEGRI